MKARRALIVGGAGALGKAVVRTFSRRGWLTLSLDFHANEDADHSVLMSNETGVGWASQLEGVHENLRSVQGEGSQNDEFDAVVSVAGGFAAGGLREGVVPLERMWDMNVKSAYSSAVLASKLLRRDGTLVLTGAQAAQDGAAGFALGYSMTKAATYNLAFTLGQELRSEGSSLPPESKVLCFFPATIDTPANRDAMPDSDFTAWQTPEAIASFIVGTSEKGALDVASEAAAGLSSSAFFPK